MSGITTAIIASAVIAGGVSYYEGEKQQTAIKKAQNDAEARQKKALEDAQRAQQTAADQAQAQIDQKRRAIAGSQTIFTNPLGISDQANVIRKTTLGA